MARMRSSLVAATATIAAFAAPTTALAATTDCEGLQAALDNPANTVVTLTEGAHCNGHFNLPSRAITFEGAGTTGATLDPRARPRSSPAAASATPRSAT